MLVAIGIRTNTFLSFRIRWGVLDYAGGGPVEIGSGVGGLAYAFVLGRRKEDQLVNFRYAFSVSLARW